MDFSIESATPLMPDSKQTPTYNNPVVSNERPKLEDYPTLFSSIGLPAREDWS